MSKKPTWPPARVFVVFMSALGLPPKASNVAGIYSSATTKKLAGEKNRDARFSGWKTQVVEYRLITPRKPAKATAKKAKRRAVRRAR